MADSILIVVLIGLVVGIAFVGMFSVSMGTTLSPTDDQIIAISNNMPETKVFFSEYPDGKVEIDRTGMYGHEPLVVYQYEKTYTDGKINQARMFVGLNLLTGLPSHRTISTDCATSYVNGGGHSVSAFGPSILDILQASECGK